MNRCPLGVQCWRCHEHFSGRELKLKNGRGGVELALPLASRQVARKPSTKAGATQLLAPVMLDCNFTCIPRARRCSFTPLQGLKPNKRHQAAGGRGRSVRGSHLAHGDDKRLLPRPAVLLRLGERDGLVALRRGHPGAPRYEIKLHVLENREKSHPPLL